MKLDLTDADFARLTRFLHDAAGLVFDDARRDSLGYALGRAAAACTAFTDVTVVPRPRHESRTASRSGSSCSTR